MVYSPKSNLSSTKVAYSISPNGISIWFGLQPGQNYAISCLEPPVLALSIDWCEKLQVILRAPSSCDMEIWQLTTEWCVIPLKKFRVRKETLKNEYRTIDTDTKIDVGWDQSFKLHCSHCFICFTWSAWVSFIHTCTTTACKILPSDLRRKKPIGQWKQ